MQRCYSSPPLPKTRFTRAAPTCKPPSPAVHRQAELSCCFNVFFPVGWLTGGISERRLNTTLSSLPVLPKLDQKADPCRAAPSLRLSVASLGCPVTPGRQAAAPSEPVLMTPRSTAPGEPPSSESFGAARAYSQAPSD